MHQCEDVVPDAFPMVAHHGAVHHNEHLAVIVKNITIITIIIITIIMITIMSTMGPSTTTSTWQSSSPSPCSRRHTSIIIMSKPPSKKHPSPNPHHHPHQDNHLNPVFPGGRRPNFGSTGRSTRSVSGSERFKTMTMIVMKSTTILRMVTF